MSAGNVLDAGRVLLLALAVGCSYPSPARLVEDAAVDADAVDADIDALVEIDANTDSWPTDGGVSPKTCTSSFDEDGDGRADDCDVCPLDPDPGQADQDHDGIGDICDPHPMYAVERLAYFSGFNATLATEGVKISTSGTWSTSGSLLRQTATTQGRTLFLLVGGPWRRPTIELKIADMQLNGTNPTWYSGAYILQSPAPQVAEPRPESIMCLVRYAPLDTSNPPPRLRLVRIRNISGDEVAATEASLQMGTSVTVRCSAEHLGELVELAGKGANVAPNALPPHIVIQSDPTDVETSKIGLWTYYGRADFSGIAVYENTYP